MIWLSRLLVLLTGLLRFADGSSLDYPRFVTTALTALSAGTTAWVASSSLTASVVVGLNAAICIQVGCTKWGSLQWQLIRGGFFGLLQIMLLTYSVSQLSQSSALGMFLCYSTGYVVYYGVDKIRLPKFTWEQLCRIIQGSLIAASGLFV
jgi:hypothetical protein